MKIAKSDLAKILLALGEIYRQPPLSSLAFDMYYEDLQSYALEQIKKAVQMHRRDEIRGKYMPVTADFMCQLQKITAIEKVSDHRCQYFEAGMRCENPFHSWERGEKRCADHLEVVMRARENIKNMFPPMFKN